jgi:hypothetical protein
LVGLLLFVAAGVPAVVQGAVSKGGGVWVTARDGARAVAANAARLTAHGPRAMAPFSQGPAAPLGTPESWEGGGIPVVTTVTNQFNPTVATDNAGGVIASWNDFRRGFDSYDIYAQRLDVNGNRLWPAAGVVLSSTDSTVILPQTLPDGGGGAFVIFGQYSGGISYSDILVQHVTSTGAIASGWPANGLSIAPAGAQGWGAVETNDGFLLMGWQDLNGQLRILRLTGAGVPASGWNSSGLALGPPNNEGNISPAPDGSGGGYLCWVQNDSLLLTRVTSGGAFASGWTADGTVAITTGVGPALPILSGTAATLLSSGDVMVFWSDVRSFISIDVYAKRYTAAGAVASGWPAEGLLAVAGDGNEIEPQAVSDGAGGAVVACVSGTDSTVMQRLTGDGTPFAGWVGTGVTVCKGPSKTLSAPVSDGAGGALIAWSATTGADPDIFAQRIAGTGAVAGGWLPDGKVVSNKPEGQYNPAIVSDNAGGLIAVWEDARDLANQRIYAGRVLSDGTVGTDLALVSASAAPGLVRLHWLDSDRAVIEAAVERARGATAFVEIGRVQFEAGHAFYEDRDVIAGETYRYRLVIAESGGPRIAGEVPLRVPDGARLTLMGFMPNPAVGAARLGYALASGERARLDVIDVAGRMVLERDLDSSPGEHVVALDTRLGPGMYMLRLTQGAHTVTARALVMR